MPLDVPLYDSVHPVSWTLGAALAAMVVAISLVCCARQPEPARHTVDQYRFNPALRREQVAHCSNDPGALRDTPDCINVRQATLLEDSRSVRELPPIHLQPPDQPPASPRE